MREPSTRVSRTEVRHRPALRRASSRRCCIPSGPSALKWSARSLRERGVLRRVLAARDASDAEIERVTYAGLRRARRARNATRDRRALSFHRRRGRGRSSCRAARRAAGGAVVAVRDAALPEARPSSHSCVRPATTPRRIAEWAFACSTTLRLRREPVKPMEAARVLVADFDYHHGNGTEAVAGAGLSYCSTHAYPAYPGTGGRSYWRGDDLVANVPLPVGGISTEAFVAVWERVACRRWLAPRGRTF